MLTCIFITQSSPFCCAAEHNYSNSLTRFTLTCVLESNIHEYLRLHKLHFHSSCLQNKELAYSMVSDILSVTTHGDEETHNMNSIFRVDSGGAVVVNQDISYQNYRYFQFDVSYVFIHILYVCSTVCMCMYVHTQAVIIPHGYCM